MIFMQRTTEALQNMDEKENMRRMSNTESGNFLKHNNNLSIE